MQWLFTDTVFVSSYPHNWPVCATLRREQHLGTALPLAIQEISSLLWVMTTVLHMVLQNEKDIERFLIWKVLPRWLINHFPRFFSLKILLVTYRVCWGWLFYGGFIKWLMYQWRVCNELWERQQSYCMTSIDHVAFLYSKMHRCTGKEGVETNVQKWSRFLIHGMLTIFMWYYGNMVIPSNSSLNS